MSVSELVSFSAENEKYSFGRSLVASDGYKPLHNCGIDLNQAEGGYGDRPALDGEWC